MKILRRSLLAGTVALLCLPAMAAAETARIGVINALTGPYAFGGVPIQNAMKIAIDQANASGDLPVTLEIVEGDTASEKGQTITLVSRMAQSDNALMIIGPTTSLEATGGAPVANELKIPLMAIGSSQAILAAGPWSFKVQAVGSDIMGALSDYAVQKMGVKKVAIIFDRGNDGFVGQTNAFKAGMLAQGVEIVSEDGILATDSDFIALATKLAASDVDAFFVAAPAEVGANFLLQARQGGVPMSVPFLGPSTYATEAFMNTAGGATEGSIVLADYFAGSPNPLNVAFVKAYQERHGVQPDNWAAMGYALAQLSIQAIRDAGPSPDREKVRMALEALQDEPTVIGNHVWSMDEDRNPSYGAAILEVRDGAFHLAP